MKQEDTHISGNLIQVHRSPTPHQVNRAETDSHIQLELRKLDMDLALTLANRSNLVRHVKGYCTSLAPCNKLPSELIGEIILLTEPGLSPLPLDHGRRDPRLQYTQICSHWRRAAFELNLLWNTIELECHHTEGPLNLVAMWLWNSCSAQIVLKILGFAGSFDAGYFREKLLVPYSHRLKLVDSMLTDANHFHHIPFNVLTSLSLLYVPRETNAGGFMVAPLLQHFHVREIESPTDGNSLISFLPSIPWTQLTSLSLDGSFSFSDLSEILLQCKLLESCHLDSVDCDSPGDFQSSVDLPRLKLLQIKFGFPHHFHLLFSLSLPNLSTLIVNVPPNAPGVLKTFSDFMMTLQNTLRHLEITKSSPAFRHWEGSTDVDIVRTFPFVTHFVSKELFIAPATLAEIGSGELLPNLETIELMAPHDDTVADIVDSLIPRYSDRISPLKNIYIHTDERYYIGDGLPSLHSNGINVWVV